MCALILRKRAPQLSVIRLWYYFFCRNVKFTDETNMFHSMDPLKWLVIAAGSWGKVKLHFAYCCREADTRDGQKLAPSGTSLCAVVYRNAVVEAPPNAASASARSNALSSP